MLVVRSTGNSLSRFFREAVIVPVLILFGYLADVVWTGVTDALEIMAGIIQSFYFKFV